MNHVVKVLSQEQAADKGFLGTVHGVTLRQSAQL